MSRKKSSHTFRRMLLFVLTLLVLGGMWVFLSHGTPPTTEELEGHPHRLKVLTWNTARVGNFKKPAENEVLHYLLHQDADVICLQEVDVYKNARFLTLQEMKDVLSSKYRYSYIDFSQYDNYRQFGTMVWSHYPLINKHSIHYATQGNLSNRCDIVVGDDTLRLINNHLESYCFTPDDLADVDSLHNYEGLRASLKRLEEKRKRATPLRNAQARIIHEEVKQSPYPVLVVGDFNAIPLSYAYWRIRYGLHDAWTQTSWGRYGATCVHRHVGVRIDYILCSDPLIPLACDIPQAPGSDHKPVIATVAW